MRNCSQTGSLSDYLAKHRGIVSAEILLSYMIRTGDGRHHQFSPNYPISRQRGGKTIKTNLGERVKPDWKAITFKHVPARMSNDLRYAERRRCAADAFFFFFFPLSLAQYGTVSQSCHEYPCVAAKSLSMTRPSVNTTALLPGSGRGRQSTGSLHAVMYSLNWREENCILDFIMFWKWWHVSVRRKSQYSVFRLANISNKLSTE